jgi:hypothetical protein
LGRKEKTHVPQQIESISPLARDRRRFGALDRVDLERGSG